jgi:hypothetical protein
VEGGGGPRGPGPVWLAFGSRKAHRLCRDPQVVTRVSGKLALGSENVRISHNKGLHQRQWGIDVLGEKALHFPPVRSRRLKGTQGCGRYPFCGSPRVEWERNPV